MLPSTLSLPVFFVALLSSLDSAASSAVSSLKDENDVRLPDLRLARAMKQVENEDDPDDEAPRNLRGGYSSRHPSSFSRYRHKQCRKRHGQAGRKWRDYMLIENYTRGRCEKVCKYFEYCYGYEFDSSDQRCEIWHETPIDKYELRYSYGTDCYVKDHFEDYYDWDDHYSYNEESSGEDDDDTDEAEDDDDGEDDNPRPTDEDDDEDGGDMTMNYEELRDECIEDCKEQDLSSKEERKCIKECKRTHNSNSGSNPRDFFN